MIMILIDTSFIPPLFIYLFIIINIFGISEIKIFLLNFVNDGIDTVPLFGKMSLFTSCRYRYCIKQGPCIKYTFERIILPSYYICKSFVRSFVRSAIIAMTNHVNPRTG